MAIISRAVVSDALRVDGGCRGILRKLTLCGKVPVLVLHLTGKVCSKIKCWKEGRQERNGGCTGLENETIF